MRAAVNELSPAVCGIDVSPEEIQQLFISDYTGIEVNLNGFHMSRFAVILISRMFSFATGIAGNHFDDTGNLFKIGLHAPETAAGKCSDLSRFLSLCHFIFPFLRSIVVFTPQSQKQDNCEK
ncbi:MAG: hypothetical protein A4E66_02241 [Syntrophus sp. PtaB.Bin001]|nr:MAG: hypothetical protein A4E66_02241 [Syntrophus sp. PtaB.Bin001]